MAVLESEPLIIEDERSKALLFALMSGPHASFELAELMRLWFSRDTSQLAAFMNWLDLHGLEIRKKK